MRKAGIGEVAEGKFKGRQFIIPSEVWVATGESLGGVPKFAKACLLHEVFIPDSGCAHCQAEDEAKRLQKEQDEKLGLQ